MISVVVSLFNKEYYICETVQSVLNQTFDHFELLIINDGSTDASKDEVLKFNDERIRIISIENSGVSVARNTGIQNAKYDWIALLDADDWWAPTFLSEIVNAIENNPEHKIFATGRNRVFKSETERYSHEFLPKDGKSDVLNYYQTIAKYLPLINSSNVAIHKSIFENYGCFKPGQKKHEDHDLWLRLCVENEVGFVNKPLSFYRKTDDNTASNDVYKASDFVVYLETIQLVYDQLSEENKRYLKTYANRFIALTYLKNYGDYTSIDRKSIVPYIDFFCRGNYKRVIQFSKIIPFSMYPFLKLLQR